MILYKVLTLGFLRKGSLSRADRSDPDSPVFTGHFAPFIECITQEESSEDVAFFLSTAVSVAKSVAGIDLQKNLACLNSDQGTGLESARKEVLGNSRRVEDYYHICKNY